MKLVRFSDGFCKMCGETIEHNHDVNGKWIRLEDVEKLQAELEQVKRERDEAIEIIPKLISRLAANKLIEFKGSIIQGIMKEPKKEGDK